MNNNRKRTKLGGVIPIRLSKRSGATQEIADWLSEKEDRNKEIINALKIAKYLEGNPKIMKLINEQMILENLEKSKTRKKLIDYL